VRLSVGVLPGHPKDVDKIDASPETDCVLVPLDAGEQLATPPPSRHKKDSQIIELIRVFVHRKKARQLSLSCHRGFLDCVHFWHKLPQNS
jgi:hypothetical protein